MVYADSSVDTSITDISAPDASDATIASEIDVSISILFLKITFLEIMLLILMLLFLILLLLLLVLQLIATPKGVMWPTLSTKCSTKATYKSSMDDIGCRNFHPLVSTSGITRWKLI